MEAIDPDEAYVRVAHAIIEQAVTDFRDLKRMSAIRRDGSINADFWSRRDYGKGYRRPKHLPAPSWARYLIEFLKGPDLEFLCDLTGFKACRIRRELGIKKGGRCENW